ncbi:S1 family peptidase [Micromonospora sp. WMMD1082]|uniref:S1 family peptidase n=1 Tax=Micromonospora sp. WMMD1082 TaxID=3016104 RepID=UPI002415BB31|nr:S1 family peptidase [Micromonospora sp. WMMD1082]MDG4795745.1 S1 family peptidase [Micromonospora sp. WMMD1082]
MPEPRMFRPARYAVASVAGLLALAITTAGCAATTSQESPGGGSSTAPTPTAGGLPEQILAAVAKSIDGTEEQARERLARQAEMTELHTTIAPSLKVDWSAGTWLDRDTGNLVVAVTNERRAAEIRARNAEPRLVTRSAQDLRNVRTQVERLLKQHAVTWVGTSIDVTKNVVVVTSQEADLPTSVATALQREFADAVDIRYQQGRDTALATASGDQITSDSGTLCSVGWWVRDARPGAARNYVMTAGHCVANGPDVSWRHAEGEIGRPERFSFDGPTGSDWALISVDDDAARRLSPSVSVRGVKPIGEEGQPDRDLVVSLSTAGLARQTAFLTGTIVCKNGRTTQVTCGRVIANDVDLNIAAGEGRSVPLRGVTRVSLLAQPGDSGGPVFILGDRDQVTAIGVVSAASGDRSNPLAATMTFQLLDRALTESGTRLVIDPNAPR